MSQQSLSSQASKSVLNIRFVTSAILVSVIATVVITLMASGGRTVGVARVLAESRLHAPRFSLLADAPIAIQIHVAAVVSALVVGLILMSGVKGSRLHRTLGWGWVAAMGSAAIASLFIQQLTQGHGFSWLHLFSGWTMIALPIGVVAARRHKVRAHARTMTGLFLGGLVVAGVTAFIPGRLMWQVFFG